MPPLRFGQVSVLMDTNIRADGKIVTWREFIISCIKEGWSPQKGKVLFLGTIAEGNLRRADPEPSISHIKLSMSIRSARLNMILRIIWRKATLRLIPDHLHSPCLDKLCVAAAPKRYPCKIKEKSI